jgi:hypothetical protein
VTSDAQVEAELKPLIHELLNSYRDGTENSFLRYRGLNEDRRIELSELVGRTILSDLPPLRVFADQADFNVLRSHEEPLTPEPRPVERQLIGLVCGSVRLFRLNVLQ